MNNYFWLAFLPLHLFLIPALFFVPNIWLVLFFYVLLSGIGVGVTLHRLLSHRSFKTTKTRENILSFISVICAQGSPIFWVNLHRGYHHRHSDTEKDIHSPIHGKLWAYFLWTIKIDPKDLNYKFSIDLYRNPFQLWLNNHYFKILWTCWIVSFIISPTLFASLVVGQLISMHIEFFVNLFCHTRGLPGGYRNFDTSDNSVNYWLPGILCWGAPYHNNHHANPNNYDFGHTGREVDFTKYLVKLIKV